MLRSPIRKIRIEYHDGTVEEFEDEKQELNMVHIRRQEYPRGATKTEEGFTAHTIRWNEDKSLYSNHQNKKPG